MKTSTLFWLALSWVACAQLPDGFLAKVQIPSAAAVAAAARDAEARAAEATRKADDAALQRFLDPERVPSEPAGSPRQSTGPHHRVHRIPALHTNEVGGVEPYQKQIIQLETGLNRQNGKGEWVAASDELEIEVDGASAVARQTRHSARFASQLNQPRAIQVTGPDGHRLAFTPVGLIYFDPLSGQSAVIAQLRKSVRGVKAGRNELVYPRCFQELDVDLRYRNSKRGVEQDVIVNQQLPSPASFGLNPLTTRLQVATEFFDYPEPTRKTTFRPQLLDERLRAQIPDAEIRDEALDFGDLRILEGQIFSSRTPASTGALYSSKEFIKTPDGRTILFEVVPFQQVEPFFRDQPVSPSGRNDGAATPGPYKLPAVSTDSIEATTMLAINEYRPQGVVLDFPITTVSSTSLTLMGNTTYVVTGECNFNDLTIEAGTVVKYLSWSNGQPNSWIRVNGSVTCKSTPYRPAVFTSINDDSVGDLVVAVPGVPNSTGIPLGAYGTHHLVLGSGQSSWIQNCRFRYGQESIWVQGGSATIRHCQFQDCVSTLLAGTADTFIENCLIFRGNYNLPGGSFAISISESPAKTHRVHQCTIDGVSALSWVETLFGNPPAAIEWRNNLILRVNTINNYANTLGDFYSPTVPAGFFTAIDLNQEFYYHLSPGNLQRNIPNLETNVSPSLLRDLRKRTTTAPILLTGYCPSNQLVLAPRGLEDTDALDRGYHQPVLDYVAAVYQFAGPASVLLTNGVNVGVGAPHGFNLGGGSVFVSEGRPNAPNRLVRKQSIYGFVQNAALDPDASGLLSTGYGVTALWFRHTEFPAVAGAAYARKILKYAQYNPSSLSFRDCLLSGTVLESIGQDAAAQTLRLHNNVFERADLTLYPSGGQPVVISARNNTFWGSTFTLIHTNGAAASGEIRENIFDNVSFGAGINTSLVALSHNAYVYPTTAPVLGDTIKLNLGSFTYVAGPFGNWYQGSSSLADQGQQNSIVAGLYHHTARLNQTKELASTVDLGFHYPAAALTSPSVAGIQGANGWFFRRSITNGGPPNIDLAWGGISWNYDNFTGPPAGSNALAAIVGAAYTPASFSVLMSPGGTSDVGLVYQLPRSGAWYLSATTSDANVMSPSSVFDGVRLRAMLNTTALSDWVIVPEASANVPYAASFDGSQGDLLALMLNNGANGSNAADVTGIQYSLFCDQPTETSGLADCLAEPTYSNGLAVAVDWSAPAHLQSFTTSPVAVGFDVTATPSSAVKQVEYYVGSALIGIRTNAPFTFSTLLGQGNFTLWTKVVGTNNSSRIAVPRLVFIPAANVPPNVVWQSPVSGAVLNTPTGVVLSATATDSDGTVKRVEFYTGSTLIGSVTNAPGNTVYNLVWPSLPSGTYPVKARAYDNNDAFAETAPINFTVIANLAPAIAWLAPANNTLLPLSPTNVVLSATATDADGIAKVEFYNGSTKLGEVTAATAGSTYSWVWTGVGPGTYSLKAKAYDNLGQTAETAPVISLTLNSNPTVSIILPTTNQVFAGIAAGGSANILLRATASDADGSVANVVFYSGSNLIASVAAPTDGFYETTWTGRTNGFYAVYAVVTDNRGATFQTSPRVFEVRDVQTRPQVAVLYPLHNAVLSPDSPLTLQAGVLDNGPIQRVEFYEGTNWLGSAGSTTTNFYLNRPGLPPGKYRFWARAVDAGTPIRTGQSGVNQVSVSARQIQSGNGVWVPISNANDPTQGAFNSGYSSRAADFSQVSIGPDGLLYGGLHIVDTSGMPAPTGLSRLTARGWNSVIYDYNSSGTYFQIPVESFSFVPFGVLFTQGGALNALRTNSIINLFSSSSGSILTTLSAGDLTGTLVAGGNLFADVAGSVFQYSGSNWLSLGTNALVFDTTTGEFGVRAMIRYRDELYIGGDFCGTLESGVTNTSTRYLAKLQNNRWRPVSGGVDAPVYAFATLGANLLVGGAFTNVAGSMVAPGIAQFDGASWSGLAGGVGFEDAGTLASLWPGIRPEVRALVIQGNEAFVGGTFNRAGAGESAVNVGHVAKAVWDPAWQNWRWERLGYGIGLDNHRDAADATPGGTLPVVRSLALKSLARGDYELYAGGAFYRIDNRFTFGTAKYLSNPALLTNTGLPSIAITSPTNRSVFVGNSASVTVNAVVANVGSAQIDLVELFDSGTSLGTRTTLPYSFAVSLNSGAAHYLTAVVRGRLSASAPDSAFANSSPVAQVIVRAPNPNISAVDDSYLSGVLAASPPVLLPVLTNDSPGTVVTRVYRYNPGAMAAADTIGSVRIAPNGSGILYQGYPLRFGTDVFSYEVTNATGFSAQANVFVRVHAPPQVSFVAPATDLVTTLAGTYSTSITVTASDPDGSVGNVALRVNGVVWQNLTSFPATVIWSTNNPGFYQFDAFATDSDGNTNAATPVTIQLQSTGDQLPIAVIDSLRVQTNIYDSLVVRAYPTVRDGLVEVFGTVRDPNAADPVSWQLQVYRSDNDNALLANVTPGPLNALGFHAGAVISNSFGVMDLTFLPNGVYDLVLGVRGGGGSATTSVRVRLDNDAKIGAFTFSESDLVIPVNGISLTVVRTYNSFDPVQGDLGRAWKLSFSDLDVALDETRTEVVPLLSDRSGDNQSNNSPIRIRSGGGWDVTMNLPDGRRGTFLFNPKYSPTEALSRARWDSPPGFTGTLSMMGDDVIQSWTQGLGVPVWRQGGPTLPFSNFDIPGWDLTLKDGTRYELRRSPTGTIAPQVTADVGLGNLQTLTLYDAQPKLTAIVQKSDDRIEIGPEGITHRYGASGSVTRKVSFTRDSKGRVSTILDPSGVTNGIPAVRYLYHDETGMLVQVLRLQDRGSGRYLTNRYFYEWPRFPSYLTRVEDARGIAIARNQYDDTGKLVAVVEALGRTNRFIHDLTNRVEYVVDRLNATNSLGYDTRGNVIASTNALGEVRRMGYDILNNKLAETNFLGAAEIVSRWQYDTNRNLLTATTDPLGNSHLFTYDSLDRLWTVTDPRGNITTTLYDPSNQPSSVNDLVGPLGNSTFGGGLLLTSTDPLGTVTTYSYNANRSLTNTTVTSSTGVVLSRQGTLYDANLNPQVQTIYRSKPDGTYSLDSTFYYYDALNRVTHTVEADGGTNRVVSNEIGRPQATIDKLGRLTSYEYDRLGNLAKVIYPDTNVFETFEYDAQGRRTNAVDRLGRSSRTVLDALGRATASIQAFGTSDALTNRTVYDAVGRVASTVDARGVTNALGYDLAGRRTSTTNAWGTAVALFTRYQYDSSGSVTNVIDALNRETATVYDLRGQAVQTLAPPVTPGGARFVSGTLYDAIGRRVAETNAAGLVNTSTYDGLGRLVATTNGLGTWAGYTASTNWAQFQYDTAGNLTNQIDALNRSNFFAYDGLGRRLWSRLPGGETTAYGYDAVGNLVAFTNADSVVITNQFDVFNRLWKRWQAGTLLETYAYSAAGRLTNRLDESGTHAWVYDLRDRLKTNTTPVGTLYYTYDSNGNPLTLSSSTAGGVNLIYGYDALNRLTNVLDAGLSTVNQNASYQFDPVGNLAALNQLSCGVTNQYLYDGWNRLTNLVWNAGANPRAAFGYSVNSLGNRTLETENLNGANRAYQWGYDQLQRLQSETLTGATLGTFGYGLDRVGNRTNRSGAMGKQGVQNLSYSVNDWLLSTNSGSPQFDAKGNSTSYGGSIYAYDWANRLISAPGVSSVVYDADGNRIKKTAGGTITWYLVASINPTGHSQVVEEFAGATPSAATLTRAYGYGLDLLQQRQLPGNVANFYGYDGQGTVRFLLNSSGTITDTYVYDSYGNLQSAGSSMPTPNNFRYTGEQWDPNLGLYYLRARYYQPTLGRFWTSDTFEGNQSDPLSLHRYLYVKGNPVNMADPTGRQGDSIGTLAAVGLAANLAFLTVDSVSLFRHSAAGGVGGASGDYVNVAVDIALLSIPFSGAGGAGARVSGNMIAMAVSTAQSAKGSAQLAWAGLRSIVMFAQAAGDSNPEQGTSDQSAGPGSSGSSGPGQWQNIPESMSERARAYQAAVTGAAANKVYVVNGVKFDGFRGGKFLEAKGPGYASFVGKNGRFYDWFDGAQLLVEQARRQIRVAGNLPVEWHIAEPEAAGAIKTLLQQNGCGAINIISKF